MRIKSISYFINKIKKSKLIINDIVVMNKNSNNEEIYRNINFILNKKNNEFLM